MHQSALRAPRGVVLVSALLSLTAWSGVHANVAEDVRALLAAGPRVAGNEASERARGYMESQLRASGYETRRDTFEYVKDVDLGSGVRVGTRDLGGRALRDSVAGTVTAPVTRVPGVGRPQDFEGLNVRGRIVVVRRGELPFQDKVRNAEAAGAAGVIVVNNASGEVMGSLGSASRVPVVGVRADADATLRDGTSVTVSVRTQRQTVQGVNIVAFKTGTTRPEVLFGAHVDSVAGAPGANDNASGTAAVLEMARRAANTPLAARSFFVLFDAEEDGLRGSRAFVERNPEVTRGLKAMLNFDMVGVNVMPLSVGGQDQLKSVALQAVPSLRSMPNGGGSDHAPFDAAGVPALFFHRGIDANYHTPQDTVVDVELIVEAVVAGLKVAEAAVAAVPSR